MIMMMMTLTNRPQQDEQADRQTERESVWSTFTRYMYILNWPYVATVYTTTKDHWLVTEHAQEVFIGGGPPPKFN